MTMDSFPSLPSCLKLHGSLLPLVSTNTGLPAEVLFAHCPSHTTPEEQMCVGRTVKMGASSSHPSSGCVASFSSKKT